MNAVQEKALSTVKDYIKDETEVTLMIDILGLDQEALDPQTGLVPAFSGDNRPTNKKRSLRPKTQIKIR